MNEIRVSASATLGEIATIFEAKFPYLKLEFFGLEHNPAETSPRSARLDSSLSIREAGDFDNDQELSIHGNVKVSTLEQQFQEIFGIGLQVLRKSGLIWLQTTSTDDWTLGKQNAEGERDSLPVGL